MTVADGRDAPQSTAPGGASDGLCLRLLATTDLHGHLASYDYLADAPSAETGLARVASLIAEARRQEPNTLLFDNGDFLQGTPLVDYWARERGLGPGELHPMIAAMNALGYDALTLGNHEFNFGLDYLLRALQGARFPVVCANALRREGADPLADDTLLPPWTILRRDLADRAGRRHRLSIGVIGFLPPQTVLWDRALLQGRLSTCGIAEAARAHVPALRAAGADLVVALAHTGIAPAPAPGTAETEIEDAALPLSEVAGIDAIICGHTHKSFPSGDHPAAPGLDPQAGRLNGKPAVMPGRWGSHLGVIDLDLVPRAGGGWHLRQAHSALRPVALRHGTAPPRPLAPEDPLIREVCAPAHDETLRHIRREIGHLGRPLQSFFALVAPDAGLNLIAAAQARMVQSRLTGRPEAALPLLSAVAPSRCGARGGPGFYYDIPKGPFCQKTIADLYAYPNVLRAVRVSGAEIAEWLERAAAAFCTLAPGRDGQRLLDAEFPCYNFDILHGLSYEIDPSQPPRYGADGRLRDAGARRIRALQHRGQPLDPAAHFVVATNNYRVSGAGGFVEATRRPLDLGAEITSQGMLAEAARHAVVLTPHADPVWRFAALPGISALFETSPLAAGRLGLAEGVRLEDLGPTEAGFLQIRLHF